jgi:hypothetical protein
MPLPQQVIEQLGRETPHSQGWAWSALLFCGGMLFLTVAIWVGLKFGAERYWTSQVTKDHDAVNAASASVSAAEQAQIVDFYSQTANLNSALASHQFTSQFFPWLEQNTEANIYYQTFQLASGGKVTLKGVARTEADVNEQLAIFEATSTVTSVAVSGVSVAQAGTGYVFNMTLTMSPSIFTNSSL